MVGLGLSRLLPKIGSPSESFNSSPASPPSLNSGGTARPHDHVAEYPERTCHDSPLSAGSKLVVANMEVEPEGEPGSVEPSAAASRQRSNTPETGPFVLRDLLEDLPLSADGDREDIEINCVEFLGIICLLPCCHRQVLMLPRTEPLCWNICLRTPSFCANTSRSSRCIRKTFVYSCV